MIQPTEQDIAIHQQWVADGGREKLVTFDFLTPESTVWEIGGWRGEWTETIARKYDPFIHVFEPVQCWWLKMLGMFKGNPKISLWNYGLGALDRFEEIGVDLDASGLYCDSKDKIDIQIRSVLDVMEDINTEEIDVTQCNCEGGEYEIFPELIDTGLIERFKVLAIQFHNLHPTHALERIKIQDGLSQTHVMTSCYDWKFEYWERKNA